MPELVTERLRLRPLVAGDAKRVFAPLSDMRLYEFLEGLPPANVAELEARFRRWETRRSPDGRETWLNWIAERARDGLPVGWFQATVFPCPIGHPGPIAEIAYVVFVDHQRRGFGCEGGKAVLRHLFANLDCRTVTVRTDARNEASLRLAERLGFARGTRAGDAALQIGQARDEILELTRAAFRASRRVGDGSSSA
jgi:ribosomal-protein-alanine N-acetyltransferase